MEDTTTTENEPSQPAQQPEVIKPDYSPNNPPWNGWVALGFWAYSVALIFVIPAVFLLIYFSVSGIQMASQDRLQILTDPFAVAIAISGTFVAHMLTLLIAWPIVTKYRTFSFRKMLGWKWGGFKWWHGLVSLAAVYVIVISLVNLFGSHDNDMLRILRSSRTAAILIALLATFSAPIVEEVIYRGVFYSAVQRAFSVPFAVIATTLLFSLVHVPQYYPDFATIISLTILSLLLTLIRVRTDNLLPCIVFHFVFNAIQSAILLLQPYLPEALDGTKIENFFFRLG